MRSRFYPKKLKHIIHNMSLQLAEARKKADLLRPHRNLNAQEPDLLGYIHSAVSSSTSWQEMSGISEKAHLLRLRLQSRLETHLRLSARSSRCWSWRWR